jgi:hypothetical protein
MGEQVPKEGVTGRTEHSLQCYGFAVGLGASWGLSSL